MTRDYRSAIDAELHPLVDAMAARSAEGLTSLDDVRAMMRQRSLDDLAEGVEGAERVDVADRTVPGPPGAPEVPVRLYRPTGATGALPVLVMLHGGGFWLGDLEMVHRGCVRTADRVGCQVVSVDYRLAPEHPFPAGVEDCYAVTAWVAAQAAELGVDPGRVAVGGGSAGGALSAAVALMARDRGGPALCFQQLVIPVIDDRMTSASMVEFTDTPMFNRPAAEMMWAFYLGADHGDDVSPYAAPGRADDLTGLPPAYVETAEFDCLRDEGLEYGLALLRAGVSVELHNVPGTFHGSEMVHQAPASVRSFAARDAALARAFGR